MIVKKIYDSTAGTASTPLEAFDISPVDGKVMVCYNLSGGTTGACQLAVGGRVDTNATPITPATILHYNYESVTTTTATNISDEHTYTNPWPRIACYISGNSEGKRIRVWVAYNEK